MTASPAPASTPARGGLTGWHVLAIIAGFFALVFTVDGVFTYLALRSHPGQVSVTPYEDGLLYNRRIARLDAQVRLGWSAGAEARPGRVVLIYRDREGRPLPGLAVSGRLERPATEAGRQALKFVETAPGRYEAPAGAGGAWDLTAEARNARGEAFMAERRLTWP